MSIIRYTKQDDYDVVNDNQDCIGWKVTDQTGNEFGEVTEMLVNTDSEMVDSIIVDNHTRIPAGDIALRDGRVVVRGVFSSAEYESTRLSNQNSNAENPDYEAMQNTNGSGFVSGITRAADDDEIVLPIIEEQLRLGKRTVEKGAAQVRTVTEEVPVEEEVILREENVTVERRAVDRPVTDAPAAFREGTIEVTEMAEVPIVTKESRVVEEVVIGKEVTQHQETVRDTVKRTDIDVDEIDKTKSR